MESCWRQFSSQRESYRWRAIGVQLDQTALCYRYYGTIPSSSLQFHTHHAAVWSAVKCFSRFRPLPDACANIVPSNIVQPNIVWPDFLYTQTSPRRTRPSLVISCYTGQVSSGYAGEPLLGATQFYSVLDATRCYSVLLEATRRYSMLLAQSNHLAIRLDMMRVTSICMENCTGNRFA